MTVMATLCSLFALTDVFEVGDVFGAECLTTAAGVFGVPQLFEVDRAQREIVSLTHDSDGNPIIKLRHGGVITNAVAEQLNALIGETYHKGRTLMLSCGDPTSSAPPKAP
jgi:hypothetical protein